MDMNRLMKHVSLDARRHLESRPVGRPRSLVRLVASGILFLAVLAAQSPARADSSAVEDEIAAINAQIASLTDDEITPLEDEIAGLRDGMAEARTYMDEFAVRNDWLLAEYAAHRSRLRRYEGRALQLGMSYGDFFDAKNAWVAATDPALRREKIIVMFRYLYGYSREPGQWELDPNTQQDFVAMADLIVRRRAVARVGEALVLLGELTMELVDAISGIPANLKEAAFETLEFACEATSKLLPDSAVAALNETCLQFIPYLELQKQRAELLADELNAIRNQDEFGGENGRMEALAKTQALVSFEQDVLARLEPEVTAYRSNKAGVEANFATVQEELNTKTAALETLRRSLHQCIQNRIDKEFELRQLLEEEAIEENGGPTNYVTSLTAGAGTYTIATDALSSALLHIPRFAVLVANAGYVTTESAECSYTEKIGDETFTRYESYNAKKTFAAPAAQPTWRTVNPTGEVTIAGNRAEAVAAGEVPVQAALSPRFESERYDDKICSQDYIPSGSGEKTSDTFTLNVWSVTDTLFVPAYYHTNEYRSGMTGEAVFTAMKQAAEAYGNGVDLFVDGTVRKTGTIGFYFTALNADGTVTMDALSSPQTRPDGDLDSFELENEMKVLGQGTVSLWPILLDTDGLQVQDETVTPLTVTGNTVEPTVTANGSTALTPDDDVLVVVDEPALFRVSVQGPADMSRYEVKWRYFIYEETGWPTGWVEFTRHDGAADTSFSGISENWVSVNPVTLTEPSDFNRKLKIEFDVCRTYDGTVVYSGLFEHLRSIVKGNGFFLARTTTGEAYEGSSYFLFRGLTYLAPAISSQSLELRLDRGEGRSVVVPFSDIVRSLLYGTNGAAEQNLGTITVYDDYIYTSFSSIDACGSIDLGLYDLTEADLESLLSQVGVVVERTADTAMTSIDVNLFRVDYRETAVAPVYVLKGCAPVSLHHHTTRWTFFDESSVETPFTSVGIVQESTTPMTKGLKRVEIVNPLGDTVAQLGFLSASGPDSVNRVYREIGMRYSVTAEYRYDEAAEDYTGQLSRLAKHDLARSHNQLELDFRFPDGFPQVSVNTVNDINGAPLPVIRNVAVSSRDVTFEAVMPGAGHFTTLTVVESPVFGTLTTDGIQATYTPPDGFDTTDGFVLRMDGTVCDIEPAVVYFNLEGELDYSGARPVVRFTQVFTPVYAYGSYALGFAFMDADGQAPTTSLVEGPEAADQLIVEATEGGAALKISALPAGTQDQFTLGVSMPGGASGNATVDVWYDNSYPEFFTYRNREFAIPPDLVLHRFFQNFENGAQYIKNIWTNFSSGELLLDGEPLDFSNLISAADLNNLTFRPWTDFTGSTALYLYGSEDGETWSSQVRIGGQVLAGESLADLVWTLRILAGSGLHQTERCTMYDRDGDSRIGMAEALHLLRRLAGVR